MYRILSHWTLTADRPLKPNEHAIIVTSKAIEYFFYLLSIFHALVMFLSWTTWKIILSCTPVLYMHYIHVIDKGFIDGHAVSIMVLPVQYAF